MSNSDDSSSSSSGSDDGTSSNSTTSSNAASKSTRTETKITSKTFLDDEDNNDVAFGVNESFARKYNARKRREELAKVRREGKYNLDGDSDEESSETEDEDAELLTKSKDDEIARTLEMIRNRDPRIYQKDTEFYNENENEESKKKKKKTTAMYAKDYIRHALLNDTKLQDLPDEKLSYPEEQESMKRQFKAALNDSNKNGDESSNSDDDDGELFTIKASAKPVKIKENEEAKKKITSKTSQLSKEARDDMWLRNFVMQEQWRDSETDKLLSNRFKANDTKLLEVDDEEDLEELDRTDDFERAYNFRYEEEDGAQIKSYSRNVEGSMRRKSSKRKQQREDRRRRKEEEKEAKLQELKRLKALKRREIMSKLQEIEEITGNGMSHEKLAEKLDLDEEWDPEKHDAQMREVFDDDYYDAEDAEMKVIDDRDDDVQQQHEDDEVYAPFEVDEEEEEKESGNDKMEDAPADMKEREEERKRLIERFDELYAMDYEDVVGGVPFRFPYAKVKPDSYGLTTEQILQIPEKDLKQYVPLKKLAPFREREFIVTGDKRRRWLKRMREREKQEQKETANWTKKEEVVEKNDDDADGIQKKKKKKRRRGKKKRKRESEETDALPSSSATTKADGDLNNVDVKKEKTKKRKVSKTKKKRKGGISESRMAAYGL